MSRATFLAVLAVALAAWWIGRASGDDAEGVKPAPPVSVALVDVSRIFKESPRLARLRDDLRQDFDTESVAMKAIGEELKALKARADAAKDDAGEQKKIREEFETKSNEFKAEAQKLQKEFVTREVELYRLFYADVKAEVERYAKTRGITLVVRWQSTDDPLPEVTEVKDASQVMSQVNQLVVYHESLDITEAVIDQMKASGSL
jgi:Skp family chaperone for outer membrane proteins